MSAIIVSCGVFNFFLCVLEEGYIPHAIMESGGRRESEPKPDNLFNAYMG